VEHTTAVANTTRVTYRKMAEINPEVSPDGSEVLFQGQIREPGKLKHWEVWAVKTDTQHQVRRITDHQANSTDPVWSPDGRTILFTARRTMNKAIWEIPSDGLGGVRQITEDDRYNAFEPTISVEKRIAYTVTPRDVYTQDSPQQLYPDDYYIWLRDYDGANATEFVQGRTPKWSPDGRKLVFTKKSPDGDRCIWTIDANGANLTQLTWHMKKSIHDVDPSWSPDGRKIVFSSNRGSAFWELWFGIHNYDIWVMNADGSGLTQLTSYSKYEGHPSWSRDGDIYFFTCGGFFMSPNWDIWRMTPRLIETGRPAERVTREVDIEVQTQKRRVVPMPAPAAPAAPAAGAKPAEKKAEEKK
jgi:TolB protein